MAGANHRLRSVEPRQHRTLQLVAIVTHIAFNAIALLGAQYGLGVMYVLLTAFTTIGPWTVIAGPLKKEAFV